MYRNWKLQRPHSFGVIQGYSEDYGSKYEDYELVLKGLFNSDKQK